MKKNLTKKIPLFGTSKKNRSARAIKMTAVSRRDLSSETQSRRKPFPKKKRSRRPESVEKPSFFYGFLYAGNSAATRRQLGGNPPGKDNLAPAEDLHNKNPSLALSGKKGRSANRAGGTQEHKGPGRIHIYFCKFLFSQIC